MTVYNLYLYNRKGECIYYKEWNRTKMTDLPQEQEFHLMFGLICEMKSFVNKVSPTDLTRDTYFSYKTNRYKMHYYETLSGLKFILNTDLSVANLREFMHSVYEIVVNYVVRNPLENLDEQIKSELFKTKLDEFMRAAPMFSA